MRGRLWGLGLVVVVSACKGEAGDASAPAKPAKATAKAVEASTRPAEAPKPAEAPEPAEAAPSAAAQPTAGAGFAALKESHVDGASCAYDFAAGQALSGAAFQHDGEESWVGLAGRGDVRVKKVPAEGSFGGEVEEFELPDGAGHLTVAHAQREMTLSGSAAGPAGKVTAKLEGGCGD
jgi:hypothetical protein